ncbi:MAG: molybdopterin-dependent oxidoreductase, partial [Gemmatimonadales bacterium]
MTRRGFLRASVAAGGGLLIGVSLPGCGDRATGDGAGSAKDGEEFAPNAFLRIEGDGTVTITVQRPEIGQGVRTALAMIVAEELEADWRSVKVEQANLDERLYGEQYAGGSDSVQYSWDLLRRAGATARELLVQAASEEWGVSGAECEARDGRVLHGPSGRSLGYGPLAVLAARGLSEEMPDAETLVATEPALKTPGEYRLIGRRTPSLDGAEVVTGRIRFGLDTRVEDMLVATVARCPVFGGRVQGFDAAAAEAVPGVRAVVEIDADAVEDFGPNNPKMANGVAVVAESTWAAMKGRDALRIDWDPGPGAAESTEGFWRECERLAGEPAQARIRDDGDFESAMTRAARRVEATYRVPYLAHTPMEPMNAVAHVTDGRCDVWAPCQNPGYVGTAAGKVTGLPPEAVHVHVVRSGGGFGRRFYADYAAEAVYLSRAVGAPVQVVWSREDDVRHGFYRPAGHHVLTAGLDPAGRPVAWRHFLANASRHAALGRGGDPREAGELDDFDFPALTWAAQGVEAAGGRPDRAHLLAMERIAPTLRALRLGDGSLAQFHGGGVGIAGSYSNSSYVAHVVEVSAPADGRVRVERVVSAVDCGMVVNPSGAEAQVEGCIVYGLTAALYGEITIREGRAVQGNFDDYPLAGISMVPAQFETHILPWDDVPTGVGEMGLP